MNKLELRKQIFNKQDRLGDRLLWMPDWICNPLFELEHKLQRVWCFLLEHYWWNGYLGNHPTHCIYFDKERRDEKS